MRAAIIQVLSFKSFQGKLGLVQGLGKLATEPRSSLPYRDCPWTFSFFFGLTSPGSHYHIDHGRRLNFERHSQEMLHPLVNWAVGPLAHLLLSILEDGWIKELLGPDQVNRLQARAASRICHTNQHGHQQLQESR